MINKSDIHSGYVVKLRDGTLLMAARVGNFTKILTDGTRWDYLSSGWTEDLKGKHYTTAPYYATFYPGRDIMEVYGLILPASQYQNVLSIDSSNRKLIWKRAEPVRLTMSELCEKLGYEVEIIKEA